MKRLYLLLFLLTNYSLVFSQLADSVRIKKFDRHISLACHVTQINLDADIKNASTRKSIHYKTATATRLGLSFDYRWLAFELFTRIPAPINSDKGITQNSGLYLRANRSRYWANFILQDFSGFYWDNADPLTQLQQNRQFPLREDIRNRLLQANAFYVFSPHKFSNMAAQGENERQMRSGGSFFGGFGFTFNRFDGDSSLIPKSQLAFFPGESNIKEIVNRSFLLYGGYAYSVVLTRRVFFTLYASPGLARFSTINRFEDEQTEKIKGEWAIRFDGRLALGYNTDRYFTGMLFTAFLNNQDLGTGTSFSYGFQTFRIFLGRRFELKHRLGILGL